MQEFAGGFAVGLAAEQVRVLPIAEAQVAGARIVAIEASFDDPLRLVRQLVDQGPTLGHPITLVNSLNPYRLAGQKTGAFEVCEDLGGAPDRFDRGEGGHDHAVGDAPPGCETTAAVMHVAPADTPDRLLAPA